MADSNNPFGAVISLPTPPASKSTEYLGAYKGWAYSAISLAATTEASIPIELFKREGDDIVPVPEHPAMATLIHTNSTMTFAQLRVITRTYLWLQGEAVWALVRNGGGEIQEIWPLRPDWVTLKPDGKGGIAHYEFKPEGFSQMVELAPENVIFMKDFDPESTYRGYGKIKPAAVELDIDEYQNNWNRNYFFNSAMPSVILSISKSMDMEQKKRFMEQWRQNFGGTKNSNKVALMDGGDVKVDVLSKNMKEMDYLESKKYLRDAILAVFHTSKSNLGITDDVNRANAEANNARYMRDVVKPNLTQFVGFLNEFYLDNWPDEDLFFNFEDPVPENVEAKISIYDSGLKSGWLTINEVREREELPPAEGGDIIYLPSSLQPLGTTPDGMEEEEEVVDEDIVEEEEEEKGGLRGLFRKKKKKSKNFIKLKVKKQKDRKPRYNFGMPIPARKTLQKDKVKKVIKSDLVKLILYIMENKNKEPEKAFSEEAKDAFWKQIIAKTDIQEAKLRQELKELADEQQDDVISKLRSAKRITSAERFAFNKKQENKKWEKRLKPFLTRVGLDKLEEMLDIFGIRRQVDDPLLASVENYLNDEGLIFILEHLNTMDKDLVDSLRDGIGNGESELELIERVENQYSKVSPINESKAGMIARIAIFGTVNWALIESFKRSGVAIGKEWLTAGDESVRPSHAAAHGQIVGLEEDFILGSGNRAFRPLDPSLPPEDSINCRCVTNPVISRSATVNVKGREVNVNQILQNVKERMSERKEEARTKVKASSLQEQIDVLKIEKKKLQEDMIETKRLTKLRSQQIIEDGKEQVGEDYEESARIAGVLEGTRSTKYSKELNEIKKQKIMVKDENEALREKNRLMTIRGEQKEKVLEDKFAKEELNSQVKTDKLLEEKEKGIKDKVKDKMKGLLSREKAIESKENDLQEKDRIAEIRTKQKGKIIDDEFAEKTFDRNVKIKKTIEKENESVGKRMRSLRSREKTVKQNEKDLQEKGRIAKIRYKQTSKHVEKQTIKSTKKDIKELERVAKLRAGRITKSAKKQGAVLIEEGEKVLDKAMDGASKIVNKGKTEGEKIKVKIIGDLKKLRSKAKDAINNKKTNKGNRGRKSRDLS